MPYKAMPTDAVIKMADDMNKKVKKLKELEKAKGEKAQIAALTKEIETESKAIGKKLDDDIGQVKKNAIEHFEKIDAWLGQCEGFLTTAKESLERFKKSGQSGEMSVIEGGPGTITAMAKIAQTDADDFGKSWFQYRGLNPSSPPMNLDKKYCANFSKVRSDTMNSQKSFGAKIDRMEMLSKQAEGIVKLAKAVAAGNVADIAESRKEAETLRKEVEILAKEVEAPKVGMGSLRQNVDTIGKAAKLKTTTKDHHNMLQGILKNAIAIHKGIGNRVKTMTDLIKNAKAGFDADTLKDGKVKAAVDEADKDLKEAQKNHTEAGKLIAQASKDMAVVAKIAK
jgi:hypothetical protein